MFEFIRTALAVPDIEVANVEYNLGKITEKLEEAEKRGADIVVFPELSLTGYTCADLFFQKSLYDSCKKAVSKLVSFSVGLDFVFAVGSPVKINGQLYNCAVVIGAGKVLGIVPKTFMPNYNEFYEKRWFSTSEDLNTDFISSSELGLSKEYEIPVGRDLIFSVNGEYKFAAELCEDLWTPVPPSSFAALGGAELIINLSASNETISKRSYRRELVKQQSARTLCAYAYVSAGSCESTTDLIFSGHSMVAENGTLLCENKNSIDSGYLLVCDVDLGKIRADRAKLKSFKDSVRVYGSAESFRLITVSNPNLVLRSDGSLYNVRKLPFVPDSKDDRQNRCKDIFEMQVAGLKKRLSVTSCKAVVGVSGGLDSTLALLVAAEATRQLGRPLTDVYGITMPCYGTTDRTYNNSVKLMKSLGITYKDINIKTACSIHFEDIGHDPSLLDLTYENVQARERTQVLMDYAGKVGGLVVGTGDLSELALGWCTYNADHMSMYGVNASIPKTLIRWMIDSIAKCGFFPESTEILEDIIDTPISPELLPPDAEGKIAQITEDLVGPYALHDFFLYYVMRYGFEPEKVFALAKRAFCEDYDSDTVKKWLKVFYKRFFSQQYKRSCLPDGVKVGSICLSPRGDWRMPSDASANIWLDAAERL